MPSVAQLSTAQRPPTKEIPHGRLRSPRHSSQLQAGLLGGHRPELPGLPPRGGSRERAQRCSSLLIPGSPFLPPPAEENILLSIPQPVGFIGLKKSLGSRVKGYHDDDLHLCLPACRDKATAAPIPDEPPSARGKAHLCSLQEAPAFKACRQIVSMLAYRDVVKLVAQRSSTRHVERKPLLLWGKPPAVVCVRAAVVFRCQWVTVRVLFLSGELLLHPQEALVHTSNGAQGYGLIEKLQWRRNSMSKLFALGTPPFRTVFFCLFPHAFCPLSPDSALEFPVQELPPEPPSDAILIAHIVIARRMAVMLTMGCTLRPLPPLPGEPRSTSARSRSSRNR